MSREQNKLRDGEVRPGVRVGLCALCSNRFSTSTSTTVPSSSAAPYATRCKPLPTVAKVTVKDLWFSRRGQPCHSFHAQRVVVKQGGGGEARKRRDGAEGRYGGGEEEVEVEEKEKEREGGQGGDGGGGGLIVLRLLQWRDEWRDEERRWRGGEGGDGEGGEEEVEEERKEEEVKGRWSGGEGIGEEDEEKRRGHGLPANISEKSKSYFLAIITP
ncbi:unnamed protein product [Merluccius merluccius]